MGHMNVMVITKEVLVEWIMEKGWWNIPLHPSAVAENACAITGLDIGESWVWNFCAQHPELKAKWTTGLEKCHAGALNPNTVAGFHKELLDIKEKYKIKQQNMSNMDEKGI